MPEKEKFLSYLPEVFQQSAVRLEAGEESFIARFLHIFEDLFYSLEEKVEQLPRVFDPWATDEKFLDWLAEWFALSIDRDWDERQKRVFVSRVAKVYNRRGAIDGLEIFLNTDPDFSVKITEDRTATNPPAPKHKQFTFTVTITSEATTYEKELAQRRKVRTIVNREKPAHTHYTIIVKPSEELRFRVGVSKVGIDTIVG